MRLRLLAILNIEKHCQESLRDSCGKEHQRMPKKLYNNRIFVSMQIYRKLGTVSLSLNSEVSLVSSGSRFCWPNSIQISNRKSLYSDGY